ncbi:MAG TPA: NAD(P)H-hydrate epimerase, partial [Verrucomicrobiae bacterium]
MPVPVINIGRMREWESATWATGQTEAEVIRRVGKKIARRARKLTRSDDLILILAGKGHNGDDAVAAKEFLENRRVEIIGVTDPEAALVEFQRRTGVAPVSNFSVSNGDRRDARPALIVDGLFGIGLNRQL